MATLETIKQRTAAFIGQPVRRCAILFPPITHEMASSRRANVSRGGLGNVGPAVELAEGEELTGLAARMPYGSSGILAIGESEVHFLKFKIGGSPKESVASWPIDDVTVEFIPKQGWGSHHGVRLVFSDGSAVELYGERRWGVKQFE